MVAESAFEKVAEMVAESFTVEKPSTHLSQGQNPV
jgi:hypothetical protein